MIVYQTRGALRCLALLWLAVALAISQANAGEWYLKIDGLPEAQDEPGLAGWTVVLDINAQAQVSIDPTNRVPGAPVFACEIRKTIDRLSPLLMQGCATGQLFRRLNLASAPTNGVQYRIILESVRIASFEHRNSTNPSAPALEETVRIQFSSGRIEMASLGVNDNGGVTGGLTAVFNPSTGEGKLKPRLPFRASITHDRGRAGVLIRWPAETGHRYRIWSRATTAEPWKSVTTYTGLEDGTASYFMATPMPLLFLRVEEVN
jgi:type VI protein secretion system component Hcp